MNHRLLISTSALLVASALPAPAEDLRTISAVDAIRTYRAEASMQVGDDPILQSVSMTGTFGKSPERHDVRVVMTEGSGNSHQIDVRLVDGQLYTRFAKAWAPIDKYHLDEVVLVTPDQLVGAAGGLERVGETTRNGRSVVHLRGDRDDIPVMGSGSDTIDFSRMDHATMDLWVDDAERFIVAVEIEAQAPGRDGPMPVRVVYEYSDFNQPVTVEAPPLEDNDVGEAPAGPTAADVAAKIGFDFPIPDGTTITIYGATVNLITTMPLADARNHAHAAMLDAGFVRESEVERAADEFYSHYRNDERALGVMVFQVSDRGATIQLGALR